MHISDEILKKAIDFGAWTARRDGKNITSDELKIGPNSVDLSLQSHIRVIYPKCNRWPLADFIDLHDADSFSSQITDCTNGVILEPGYLYLGASRESFDSTAPLTIDGKETYFVQGIEGRSSAARVGLSTHANAGFGDFSFSGEWVFELSVIYPTRVYAGDRIAQLFFASLASKPANSYSGAYVAQTGATVARLGKARFQP